VKPDLVSVVTAHMVYFCASARSEIFHKNARELWVGCGQFHAGINGLNPPKNHKFVTAPHLVKNTKHLVTHTLSKTSLCSIHNHFRKQGTDAERLHYFYGLLFNNKGEECELFWSH